MIVKLLTEHHLDFISLKGGCRGSSKSTCQNASLLEISCHGSISIVNTCNYIVCCQQENFYTHLCYHQMSIFFGWAQVDLAMSFNLMPVHIYLKY